MVSACHPYFFLPSFLSFSPLLFLFFLFFSSMPPFALSLPVSHHVADALEVGGRQLLLELLPGEPLEVGVAELVAGEVGLAGHDAALEEEGLLAPGGSAGGGGSRGGRRRRGGRGGGRRRGRGRDEVGYGDAAYDPGVHVDACRLVEDSLRGLCCGVC